MDRFTTLSISVAEEINSRKVLTFIRTQMKLKNLLITDKSYFYFRFLPEVLKYEVVLFQSLKDAQEIGIFSFTTLCEAQNRFTLFITPNFFTLYEYDTPLVIKNISNTSTEDIESYIEQTYKVKISKTVLIDSSRLIELSNECSNLKNKRFLKRLHKVSSNNSFRNFFLYFIAISIVFLGFIFKSYYLQTFQTQPIAKQSQVISKEAIVYKRHTKRNIAKTVSQFLEFLKKENIEFKSVGYLGNSLNIKLLSSNKKQLLDILDDSQNRLTLKYIKLDSSVKQYIMEITLYD